MDLLPFLKGFGIGVAVAAPVGPMSVLCMRRTLVRGWRFGLNTGLGISTADAVYALVAALGLTSVSRFMLSYHRPLHFVTGLFLLYLGLKTFLARSPASNTSEELSSTASGYASAFVLTMTNPPTILSFAAMYTFLAPLAGFNVYTSAETVVGVFLGSTLWWLILTAAVATIRHAAGRRTRRAIDLISGAVLSLFGAAEVRRAIEESG